MIEYRLTFDQGYTCAISCIVAGHGQSTMTDEALRSNGFTSIKALEKANICKYDIDILKKSVEELEAERGGRPSDT